MNPDSTSFEIVGAFWLLVMEILRVLLSLVCYVATGVLAAMTTALYVAQIHTVCHVHRMTLKTGSILTGCFLAAMLLLFVFEYAQLRIISRNPWWLLPLVTIGFDALYLIGGSKFCKVVANRTEGRVYSEAVWVPPHVR